MKNGQTEILHWVWATMACVLSIGVIAGPSRAELVYDPMNVAVGPDGTVYITVTADAKVCTFDNDGRFLEAWDTTTFEHCVCEAPWGIAVDSAAVVYVSDYATRRIIKLDRDGRLLSAWDGPSTAAPSPRWVALSVDKHGHLWAADADAGELLRHDAEGRQLKALRAEYVGGLGAFVVDDQDRLLVIDLAQESTIKKLDQTGKLLETWTVGMPPFQRHHTLSDICLDPLGGIWVLDSIVEVPARPEHGSIRKLDQSGHELLRIDDLGPAGRVGIPQAVAVDDRGSLFFVELAGPVFKIDFSNGLVSRWDPRGTGGPETFPLKDGVADAWRAALAATRAGTGTGPPVRKETLWRRLWVWGAAILLILAGVVRITKSMRRDRRC